MKAVYIVSVGTSILGKLSTAEDRNISESPELQKWAEAHEWSKEATREDVPALLQGMIEEWKEADTGEIQGLSAEISPLLSIRPEVLKESPVYLFSSDTDMGYLAARVNKVVLAQVCKFTHVEVRRVPGMKLNTRELNRKGIPELMRLIRAVCLQHEDRQCVINVSGGWKPQSMLMAFAGMFLNLPVYYAHKDSEVLQLPSIEWQYNPKTFDALDIRLLNILYRHGTLNASRWRRLQRQSSGVNLDFLTQGMAENDIMLSDFGRLVLSVYLDEKKDGLTMLFNKEVFEKLAKQICPSKENDRRNTSQNRKSNSGYCFAFADMDDLKQFNKDYGHSIADEVIRKEAETLEQAVEDKQDSLCARRSGDEFWLMFRVKNQEEAKNILNTACEKVKQVRIEGVDRTASCTIAAVFVPGDSRIEWQECVTRMETLHNEMKKNSKGAARVELLAND